METLKICMLDPLFIPYPGGAEKVVYEFGKRLAKKGHDITVLTSRLPKTSPTEEMDGIHVIRTSSIYFEKLPFSFLPPPFTFMPLLNIDILKQEADIFHIHNRFWYYPGTLLTLKLLKRKKLMLTLHNARATGIDFATDASGTLYDILWANRIMENCDKITAVSGWTKRITVPERLWQKSEVILNGVDTDRFKPMPKKDSQFVREKFGIGNEELLLTNARMVKQKGYEYLLDAFAKLKSDQKHKDAKLIAIGRGPLKERILSKAKELGVSDSFFPATGIPEAELPHYYNTADVFLLSSVWEPCAVVLFEAVATGCPIVASDAGGTPEVIENQKSGILVSARDSNALCEKAKEVLENKKLASSLSKGARERAVKSLTWDVTSEKFEKVYKSMF
ncbi:MAG: glycosyltransferase family 4 protein [Candidatus Micrarchaeota archaeon]